jgi:hypothetical protein
MPAPGGDGPHAFAPVPFEILGDSSQAYFAGPRRPAQPRAFWLRRGRP